MSWLRERKLLVGLGAALALSLAGLAHVRLTYPGTSTPLFWQSPSQVSIVSSATGSQDISDGSEETALRNAIAAWNGASGSTARLIEDTSDAQRARSDWQSNDLHLIWFDEDDSSGYFPGSSSTIAITPIWFFGNGRIDDADIIFNGKDFAFTTSGQSARFDVQDVATHELGHLLGLDHSGWAGATMYPYVDSTVILHRSLSSDDVHGLRDAYPTSGHALMTGRILRSSDSSPVAGAHVVARNSDGRTVGATLADATGSFTLPGLDAGQYDLFSTPLEGPVTSSNLGAGWTVETDFESTEHGAFTVTSGASLAVGDLLVDPDVTVSLGRNTDRYPLRCESGQLSVHVVRGTGLATGSSLTASDPSLTVSPISWFGTQVSFSVTVPSGASPGHSDLIVTTAGGERSVLVAGLEVTPADPAVLFVSPNQALFQGGDVVTLTGSNFNPGARVVLGGEVYADGEAGGCTVVDQNTITLTTRPGTPSITDVVVIDPSGVEGRKLNAFQFLAVPEVDSIFPTAGTIAGGTTVTLAGDGFVDGLVLRIDGVAQSSVTVHSMQQLSFTTLSGSSTGLKLLELENPGGSTAFSQFFYVNQGDPVITSISPANGSDSGGDTVTITGANFSPRAQVMFGADPVTGLGGTPAASLVYESSTTIHVVTPATSAGMKSVLVEDTGTGQAEVLTSGYNFTGSGGGGGGCGAVVVPGPPRGRDVLGSLLWFLLLAGWVRRPVLSRALAHARQR